MTQWSEHRVSSSVLSWRIGAMLYALNLSSFWPWQVFSLNWYLPDSQKWETFEETSKQIHCFYYQSFQSKLITCQRCHVGQVEWHSRAVEDTSTGVCVSSHAERGQCSVLLEHAAGGKYSAVQSLLCFPAQSTCFLLITVIRACTP